MGLLVDVDMAAHIPLSVSVASGGDVEEVVDHTQNFFDAMPAPETLEESELLMSEFVAKHHANSTPIVVITSGGTRVKLEQNAVRFLDNFSTGSRGALSTEAFLANGYAVIFLTRTGSLAPFTGKHKPTISSLFANLTETAEGTLQLNDPDLLETFKAHQACQEGELLLSLEFETLDEYLWLLRSAGNAVRQAGRSACMYLAAAVSDFYVAAADMPEHKMQSSEGPPEIKLTGTPKMLKNLREDWAPESFLVSFKLETDINILIQKAQTSIANYGIDLVVANILETRKETVTLVTANGTNQVSLGEEAVLEGTFIKELATLHQEFIKDNVVWNKYGEM